VVAVPVNKLTEPWDKDFNTRVITMSKSGYLHDRGPGELSP